MAGIQDVVLLPYNDRRWDRKYGAPQVFRPTRSDIAGVTDWLTSLPVWREHLNRNGRDRDVVGYLNRDHNVVVGQIFRVGENFEDAKRTARRAVNDRRSLVIPSAAIQARAHSVVHPIAQARNAIDGHLPDAVLNPAERVLNPLDTSRFIQERERRPIA
jgi:hypothetical protein